MEKRTIMVSFAAVLLPVSLYFPFCKSLALLPFSLSAYTICLLTYLHHPHHSNTGLCYWFLAILHLKLIILVYLKKLDAVNWLLTGSGSSLLSNICKISSGLQVASNFQWLCFQKHLKLVAKKGTSRQACMCGWWLLRAVCGVANCTWCTCTLLLICSMMSKFDTGKFDTER